MRSVVAQFRRHMEQGEPGTFEPGNPTLQHVRGRLTVDVVAVDDPHALLRDLRRMGMMDAVLYGNTISGSLPVGQISRVIELDNLRAITAARIPLTNAMGDGLIGEGDEAMYADVVQASGLTGAGVTVGVLSDSFDQQGGYAGTPSTELPAGITVLDDTADCSNPCSDEGRGMMELIHDVAPGADLAFHTAFVGGKAGFAQGIEELAAAGAGVIVDDIIYFSEAMFQDDVIAQAVDKVVADGVAYFSAAGNFARISYEEPFVKSSEKWLVNQGTSVAEDRGFLHKFDSNNYLRLKIPNYGTGLVVRTIVLQWDQPWGGAQSDLDIGIADLAVQNVYASSSDINDINQGGNGLPIELLQFGLGDGCDFLITLIYGIGCVPDPGDFQLLVSLKSGVEPGLFKFMMFDHNISWEHPTYSPSLFGHANAAGAIAVGAAYWKSTPPWCDPTKAPFSASDACGEVFDENNKSVLTAQLEWFSAAGGTPIFFETDGSPIADPYGKARFKKPEIVGPDGTNTTFFSRDSDGDGNPNFFGTSAGAPHAAAVAALMLQADPTLTPAQIRTALTSTALNMVPDLWRFDGNSALVPEEDPDDGFDFDTGWGFVQADLAVQAVGGNTGNAPPEAMFTSACTDLACSFTDTSTDPDGTIVSWLWDFGDGNTSTEQNPSHSYASADVYTVTLTVTDDDNDSHSAQQDVAATDPPAPNAPPTASFTPSCSELTCSFTDTSTDADGTVVGWSWNFGDENTSTAQNPSHTYAAGGTYTVTLVATDDDGDPSAAAEQDVTAVEPPNAPPTAAFTVSCTDLSCSFDGSGSSDADGTIVSYAWSFGDGGSSSSAAPTHTYVAGGTYTVTLVVTDDDTATDSASQPVTVTAPAGDAVHVDLSGNGVNDGKTWTAEVTIALHDASHGPVSGVAVGGSWSGGASGSGSCTTSGGQCQVSFGGIPKKEGTATFTVTSVASPDYDASQNHETSLTVSK
ncbi:MAG TPA: PKD domain-containing protein [Thermohalobaculum sp.]|nr:PKD domain-containing protein [Thermohalobaculum sp.]